MLDSRYLIYQLRPAHHRLVSRHPVESLQQSRGGFSLVELLLTLIISGVVIAGAGTMLISSLSTTKKLEQGQSIRESANRLSYLVQIEASEAKQVSYSAPNPVPAACNYSGGGSPLFTFLVPEKDGDYGPSGRNSTIFYYLKGDGDTAVLRRCGPNVKNNGELEGGVVSGTSYTPPPYIDGVLMRSARLNVASAPISACGSDVATDKKLVFETVFTKANWRPECTVARVKTVYVCNPPTSAMLALKASDPTYVYPTGTC